MITEHGQYTPREAAVEIALGYIRLAYDQRTGDIAKMDSRPEVQRRIRHRLAQLHNKLLDDYSISGVNLEVNP